MKAFEARQKSLKNQFEWIEKKIKKAIEKTFNNDEHIIAHIVDVKEVNTLYGMTEQKFMENAEILPARKQYVKVNTEA